MSTLSFVENPLQEPRPCLCLTLTSGYACLPSFLPAINLGTGKSSFIRLISGLSLPDSGQIFIRGVRRTNTIQDEPRPDLSTAKIAVVFQNPALFTSMNIAENVGFQLLEHSDLPRARIAQLVEEALEKVGLRRDVMGLQPAQLSGGMQKRVSFARAVTHDPDDKTGVCRCPDLLLLVRFGRLFARTLADEFLF